MLLENAIFRKSGIKLRGIAIGNGWVYPQKQYPKYATFAKHNNLVNTVEYAFQSLGLKLCQYLIKHKFDMLNHYVCRYFMAYPIGYGQNVTNIYDIRKKCVGELCYNLGYITDFLNRKDV